MSFRPIILLAALSLNGAISAQERTEQPKKEEAPQKEDDTLKKAGHIVTQPGRDVGIDKAKVPPILAAAVKQPYADPGKGCRPVVVAIGELNAVIGPDFGSNSAENENKFGKLAAAGGEAVVNSLIPFRGLVREVSGAAPADRRFDAAVNAGLARRGYLHGLAVSRGCRLPAGGTAPIPGKKR